MTAQDGVLDLVQRWAAAEQENDAGRPGRAPGRDSSLG